MKSGIATADHDTVAMTMVVVLVMKFGVGSGHEKLDKRGSMLFSVGHGSSIAYLPPRSSTTERICHCVNTAGKIPIRPYLAAELRIGLLLHKPRPQDPHSMFVQTYWGFHQLRPHPQTSIPQAT